MIMANRLLSHSKYLLDPPAFSLFFPRPFRCFHTLSSRDPPRLELPVKPARKSAKKLDNLEKRPLPRYNADVCSKRDKEYYDYEQAEVEFGF